MGARPRTRLRPSARGVGLVLLALALWALGALTGLQAALQVAAALLLAGALSVLLLLLGGIGLDLRRLVLDDAVTALPAAPRHARIRVALAPGAVLRRAPIARAEVRALLPEALGGPLTRPLAAQMPLAVPVLRRGPHDLGPCEIRVRDLLGLAMLRRTVHPGGSVLGLPEVQDLALPPLLAALGTGGDQEGAAGIGVGSGELGVLARPYASGDDMRRIHWRATARTGRLMTREEEPAPAHRATLLLDTEAPAALADPMVTALSSLRRALRSADWPVTILDASGAPIPGLSADAPADAESVLRALAVVPIGPGSASGPGSGQSAGSGQSPGSTSIPPSPRNPVSSDGPGSGLIRDAAGVAPGSPLLVITAAGVSSSAPGGRDRRDGREGDATLASVEAALRRLEGTAPAAGRRAALVLLPGSGADGTSADGTEGAELTGPGVAGSRAVALGRWGVVLAPADGPLQSAVELLARAAEGSA